MYPNIPIQRGSEDSQGECQICGDVEPLVEWDICASCASGVWEEDPPQAAAFDEFDFTDLC
ncbi:hypothetical protein [Amycolatopsis sp. DSM 110486]|uniref:hypothetical protein n=1 Tax=Amycolatopsis sp. DSM 110486 TaxID=2865832 RepID=UPI001C69A3AE|nr:hypothetical protein [Amycolatopsis sp. DSM 110486]QYN17578.1 hypothetical protein K1T34_32860 [Amycolatopsis sp. DSM 110486]